VTITQKDAPAWQGAWYERTGDNLKARLKGKVGMTRFLQLHFLCEKTLMPVEGHPGYELEVPSQRFEAFMQKAGPILGATCAVLKLVTAVGRPVAKMVGVDLPKVGSFDLGALKKMKLGEATVEEVFKGTGIDELIAKVESIGQSDSEPEPDLEPEADGSDEANASKEQGLLEFADNAIAQLESAAELAGVQLSQFEDEGEDPPTVETMRASVDQIKDWINEACKKQNRPSDLEKQVIGGLSKTVMKDGRTMWLSPNAADRWAEEVEPEVEPDPEPEPERRAGRDCCSGSGSGSASASTSETLQEDPKVEEAQDVEPEPEGDPQLEPEPGPTPQQKQLRPARRWLCLSGCSASVSTTQLREI